MRSRALLLILALSAAASLHAADVKTMVYFTDAAHRRLRVEFATDKGVPAAGSECANAAACADRYFLVRPVGVEKRVPAESVQFVAGELFPTLELVLPEAPASVEDLQLMLRGMVAEDGKPIPWLALPLQPQLVQDEFGDGVSLTYQSLEPRTFTDADVQAAKVTAINPKDDRKRTLTLRVESIEPVQGGRGTLHTIHLHTGSVPRGQKLTTTVEGLESFAAAPLKAQTTVERTAFPKGRADAQYFINVAVDTDGIKGDRKYKYDMLLYPLFRKGLFEHRPRLDTTVGNKTSKAPNTIALSWELRYWIPTRSDDFSSNVSVAPIYRTDRAADNREAGADLQYEPFFRALEDKTLQQRRADLVRKGGNPNTIKWGYRVRPSVGFEWGRHVEHVAAAIDGEKLARARGMLVVLVEREQIKLTLTGTTRKLFSDEALLDSSNNVVTIERADRSFFRGDLSYDLGMFAVTLTYLDGRQPPAFTPTQSTSLGLTFKF